MKNRIDELLGRISALQDELDGEYRRAREDWARKKAELADEFARQQRRYKTGLFRFLIRSRFLVLLTAPVIYAGWMSGYGNFVQIQHANGDVSCYGHNSSLNVSVATGVCLFEALRQRSVKAKTSSKKK